MFRLATLRTELRLTIGWRTCGLVLVGVLAGILDSLLGSGIAARQAAAEDIKPSFSGQWQTTFGLMKLEQKQDQVSGSYLMDGRVRCTLQGKIKNGRLEFTYNEPDVAGEGWFRLAADGRKFSGQWREQGSTRWYPWLGEKGKAPVEPDVASPDSAKPDAAKPVPSKPKQQTGFAGLWNSTYGRLRLVENNGAVHGIYALQSGSSITGKVVKDRFEFRYREPETAGEGWFKLSGDGQQLVGQWKADGTETWREWSARRVVPRPGLRWLVVIEARWEANLAQPEYAFGDMLKAFFKRAPQVQVRRRFFRDEADLKHWCRETAFLAEPVVLCIATHGTTEGIQVGGRTISPDAIADSLRYADNLRLLHFSACLMMKNQLAGRIIEKLGPLGDFPISGYATSVDWAASAIIEFLYFDLVLVRNLPVRQAARQVGLLVPISGDRPIPGAVLRPAGFRVLLPKPTAAAAAELEKAPAP